MILIPRETCVAVVADDGRKIPVPQTRWILEVHVRLRFLGFKVVHVPRSIVVYKTWTKLLE
jgi:hypothetical protein